MIAFFLWVESLIVVAFVAWLLTSVARERELEKWKRDYGWCPTCGADVVEEEETVE